MAGLVPAIHALLAARSQRKTWMPGTSPGMTEYGGSFPSPTTLFLNTPIPEISISHTSPGFMFDGMPSVPIHITSPGSMVQYLLTSEMRSEEHTSELQSRGLISYAV